MSVFPTGVSTDADLSIAVNNLACVLNGAINSSVTTITVNTTTGFPTAGYITIDAEIIKYTSTNSTQFLGCTRGADGTSNVSHSDGSTVYHNIVAAHHNALKDEVKAIEQNLSDRIGLGSTDIIMTALRKLYLSATSYIVESSSNIISFVTGVYNELTVDGTNHATVIRGGSKLNLDGSGGVGGNTYIIESSADNMEFFTGGSRSLLLNSVNDVFTVTWTDYSASSTIVGFSSFTSKSIFYKKIGKLVFVQFLLAGVSNSTSITFTLPYAQQSDIELFIPSGFNKDNGVNNDTVSLVSLAPSASTVVIYKTLSGTSTWTASGNKAVEGQFWYQTA